MAYDESQNVWLYGFAGNLARAYNDQRKAARDFVEFWFAEDVANSPAFQDLPPNTKQELTDMVTLCQDYLNFFDNLPVATADRKTVIAPFAGN